MHTALRKKKTAIEKSVWEDEFSSRERSLYRSSIRHTFRGILHIRVSDASIRGLQIQSEKSRGREVLGDSSCVCLNHCASHAKSYAIEPAVSCWGTDPTIDLRHWGSHSTTIHQHHCHQVVSSCSVSFPSCQFNSLFRKQFYIDIYISKTIIRRTL